MFYLKIFSYILATPYQYQTILGMNKAQILATNEEIVNALKDWKSIISKYQVPNTKKAIIQLITSFGPFIGLWVLMYFSLNWSILLTAALGVINAFFLVRIFIIQHDCGHQSFTKSKQLNNLIGRVCSLFSFIPYRYWAKTHNFHHGHCGQLEVRDIGDIPTITVKEYQERSAWGRLKYRIWRNPIVTFVIAPIYYFIVSCRYPTFNFGNWKKWTKEIVKDNFWITTSYILVGWLVGWQKFLLIQVTLVVLFGIIAFWFFYVQHQHEMSYKQWKKNWQFILSAIKGSTYYKLPKMFHWLTGNIGYHHIHHLSSLIPNYNLEKCFKENAILSKYVTSISFTESLKLMYNKLWHEDQQRMISFTEFRRLERAGLLAA